MRRGFLKSKPTKPNIVDQQPTPSSSETKTSASRPDDDPGNGPILIDGSYFIGPNTDLHIVPRSAVPDRPDKKRGVFRVWPRDPNGEIIVPNDEVRGKETPNGILSWGATLYDFFSYDPMPSNQYAISFISGSRIASAVRKLGELTYAEQELEWVDNEEDPREIPVVDTAELIESHEFRAKFFERYSAVEEIRSATSYEDEGRGEENKIDYGISSILMSDRPLSSPFHPSHYPPPWPFIPFAIPYPPVLLQQRIPVHLLPETLYVHDPYNLLPGQHINDDNIPWINMPPRVYLYKLSLTSPTLEAISESRKAAEEKDRTERRILHVYRFMPTEEEHARGEPAYEVALPIKPSAPTRIEEAHLYLSPTGKLGTGNHSIVYRAEWELPRDLFVKPRLCKTCMHDELRKEVQKLKRSGQWRKLMSQAGYKVPPRLAEEEGGPHDDYEMPVPPDNEEFDGECTYVIEPQPKSGQKQTTSSSDPNATIPVLRVYCPGLRWQTATNSSMHCSHRSVIQVSPVPRTAVFQVAAKLSVENDPHLAREARVYQAFPDHFFQHWSGYNLVKRIHNPVPVHALVPQFYGYYVPVEEVTSSKSESSPSDDATDPGKQKAAKADEAIVTVSEDKDKEKESTGASDPEKKDTPPPYLSPILLLEHCGKPIDPDSLSGDDREECASLFLRFNHAGWLHESIAARNILVQPGLPTQWPIERNLPESPKSFRLIDFGRSWKLSDGEDGMQEREVLRMGKGETGEALKLLHSFYGTFSK